MFKESDQSISIGEPDMQGLNYISLLLSEEKSQKACLINKISKKKTELAILKKYFSEISRENVVSIFTKLIQTQKEDIENYDLKNILKNLKKFKGQISSEMIKTKELLIKTGDIEININCSNGEQKNIYTLEKEILSEIEKIEQILKIILPNINILPILKTGNKKEKIGKKINEKILILEKCKKSIDEIKNNIILLLNLCLTTTSEKISKINYLEEELSKLNKKLEFVCKEIDKLENSISVFNICQECKGTKEINGHRCKYCSGTGKYIVSHFDEYIKKGDEVSYLSNETSENVSSIIHSEFPNIIDSKFDSFIPKNKNNILTSNTSTKVIFILDFLKNKNNSNLDLNLLKQNKNKIAALN